MGKIFAIVLGAALLGHAEIREALERKASAHQAYVAGHYTEAEALYRSALTAFGDVRSLARAVAMENLGVSLRAQGRVAEARPLMEEATVSEGEAVVLTAALLLLQKNLPREMKLRASPFVLNRATGITNVTADVIPQRKYVKRASDAYQPPLRRGAPVAKHPRHW